MEIRFFFRHNSPPLDISHKAKYNTFRKKGNFGFSTSYLEKKSQNFSVSGLRPQISVIFHNNLQRGSHKPYGPLPQSHDCSCYLSTFAHQHWHLHPSDCRITLNYAHKNLRAVPNCDMSIGSLKLPAPEAGNFVELILIYH